MYAWMHSAFGDAVLYVVVVALLLYMYLTSINEVYNVFYSYIEKYH